MGIRRQAFCGSGILNSLYALLGRCLRKRCRLRLGLWRRLRLCRRFCLRRLGLWRCLRLWRRCWRCLHGCGLGRRRLYRRSRRALSGLSHRRLRGLHHLNRTPPGEWAASRNRHFNIL